MPDDLSTCGGQDPNRIDLDHEQQPQDCSENFGVPRERLKQAVQAVGDPAEAVQEKLAGQATRFTLRDWYRGGRLVED